MSINLINILFVFAGGGAGSVLRYLIGIGFQKTGNLPLATLFANLLACVIFGASLKMIQLYAIDSSNPDAFGWKALLLSGFCGGLSTFSTFGFETFLLLRQGLYFTASANIILSVTLCIIVYYLFKIQF